MRDKQEYLMEAISLAYRIMDYLRSLEKACGETESDIDAAMQQDWLYLHYKSLWLRYLDSSYPGRVRLLSPLSFQQLTSMQEVEREIELTPPKTEPSVKLPSIEWEDNHGYPSSATTAASIPSFSRTAMTCARINS